MKLKTLYGLHKTLSFIFALPLLLIFLTGVVLGLEPLFKTKGNAEFVGVSEILKVVGSSDGELMRAMSSGVGGKTTHLMINRDGVRYLYWIENGQLNKKNLYRDFFYLNKQIHESLLFGSIGKNVISFFGISLISILLIGVYLGFKKNKSCWNKASFHHKCGMVLFLLLLSQASSGVLIENFSFFIKDVDHLKSDSECNYDTILSNAKSFEESQYFDDYHTIYFCNKKMPLMSARLKDASVIEWNGDNEHKVFSDSTGHFMTIKKKLINFHSASFLSSFSHFYLTLLALFSLVLLLTGLKPAIKRLYLRLKT